MLFNSYEFILVFLPITLAGFFVLRLIAGKWAMLLWLIGASLTFYAAWDPRNLAVLLTSIVFNFACGSQLAARARSGRPVRLLLATGVAFNLSLIGYFKYSGFLAANLNTVFGTHIPVLELALPLAISFFTFQEIAYLVDSSRGETYGYRFREYVLMVTFFPHLIAGPIVNHRILMRQFMSPLVWRVTSSTFALGMGLFAIGLGKKVLLADSMAPHANLLFDGVSRGVSPSFADAWIGASAYTLQLYFDFSGYSDMAIGLGLLFGIRLPLNFNSPYQATNIIDFWRRWHMTLSSFLRDYLYVALGGNRHGQVRRHINLALTMLLGGLWHGAGWTFVCWGAFHGLGLIVCHQWKRLRDHLRPGKGPSRWGTALARIITLLFVVFGWVMFRADSMSSATHIMATMVGLNGFDLSVNSDRMLTTLMTLASIAVLVAITQYAPNTQEWFGYDPGRAVEEEYAWARRLSATSLHGAAIGCLIVLILTQMSAVQAFLYFQF